MKVSIIIPAYNAATTLDECLEACLAQTHEDCEVIVVDDGSSDTTAAIAQRYAVTYVHQENAGPAAARNHGARVATGEFVALTDSDCIAEPNWIEELITGFNAENVVAVGGTYGIANPESPLARVIHAEIQLRHEQFGDTVDFLGSFNVAYKRDVFLEVGGFDEDFRVASAEDNDLAYRLHDTGALMRFVPTAVVNHYHPTKVYPYLKTQMNHGFWRMKLYAKHPKRAGGDHYAGKLDFLAIPLALLFPLLILSQLCIAASYFLNYSTLYLEQLPVFGFSLVPLGGALAYIAITLNRNKALAKRSGLPLLGPDPADYDLLEEAPEITYLLYRRDLFRGLGLIKGVVYFMLLRKETI